MVNNRQYGFVVEEVKQRDRDKDRRCSSNLVGRGKRVPSQLKSKAGASGCIDKSGAVARSAGLLGSCCLSQHPTPSWLPRGFLSTLESLSASLSSQHI